MATDENTRKKMVVVNHASVFFWEEAYRYRNDEKILLQDTKYFVYTKKNLRVAPYLTHEQHNNNPKYNSELLIKMILNKDFSYNRILEICGVGKDLFINKSTDNLYNALISIEKINKENIPLLEIKNSISLSNYRLRIANEYIKFHECRLNEEAMKKKHRTNNI